MAKSIKVEKTPNKALYNLFLIGVGRPASESKLLDNPDGLPLRAQNQRNDLTALMRLLQICYDNLFHREHRIHHTARFLRVRVAH